MSSVDATHYFLQYVFLQFSRTMYRFIELGNSSLATSEENISLPELFILHVYFGIDHRYNDIKEARCTPFFKSPYPKLKDTVCQ